MTDDQRSTPDLNAEPNLGPTLDPSVDPTPPRRPQATGPVQYRGEDLEPERGPGLGCFRFQLVVLTIFIVLTPLSVRWGWPRALSGALLFAVILLLLVTGQTIIFLLRLVAADRRGRRRPLSSETRTVGELEDAAPTRGAEHAAMSEAEPAAAWPPSAAPSDPATPADEAAVAPVPPPRAGGDDSAGASGRVRQ